jgi:ubiquinone/menaquinone biosynthesis C-methylase UbiE
LKYSSLDLLCCPSCHGKLSLREDQPGELVEKGTLLCPSCQRDFPIVRGVPKFIRMEELTGLNRRFARFYDYVSYIYFPFSRLAYWLLGGEEKNRRQVLDRLEPGGGRVLEVSIGPGVNLPYLICKPGVTEVFGLDISFGQLQRGIDYCRKRGWSVDLFLGMAEALPFRDASFDSVFHIGGINFFSDKQKAIREMIRVARPGTKIVIADETEKGARWYERFPFFRLLFQERRETVTAPLDLVPHKMEDPRVDLVWRGMGYCLEFRKPGLCPS